MSTSFYYLIMVYIDLPDSLKNLKQLLSSDEIGDDLYISKLSQVSFSAKWKGKSTDKFREMASLYRNNPKY